MSAPAPLKLSFCMTAYNRARLIGATLESIISQATEECEIVVLDGGSTDDTPDVIAKYAARFPGLRYIRLETNTGMDQGFDSAVEMARGEYCWVLSCKDLVKPGAVATVLAHLRKDPSVIVVNMEIRDTTLSNVLVPRSAAVESDVVYGPEEADRLFSDALNLINHVSCSIIKREIWIGRERARYYDTLYIIPAIIFQRPLPGKAILVAQALVCHRFGGQSWLNYAIRQPFRWSSLVESLPFSEQTKRKYARSSRMERFTDMLLLRAFGLFTWSEYRRFRRLYPDLSRKLPVPRIIALFPGRLLNIVLVFQTKLGKNPYRKVILERLKASQFNVRNWGSSKEHA